MDTYTIMVVVGVTCLVEVIVFTILKGLQKQDVKTEGKDVSG